LRIQSREQASREFADALCASASRHGGGDIAPGVGRCAMQRTSAAAAAAPAGKLPEPQARNLYLSRQKDNRGGVCGRQKPQRHARYESNVAIHSTSGAALASKDYSSPGGANGYYVVNAKWSPDSQFFAYSMMSSGGHSPWSFPIWVYSVKRNQFASFSDMINGSPTISGAFTIAAPHTLHASTWKQPGDLDDKVPVSVDLETAFDRLPAPSK
jgi:hypothetical protein